jgi:hypothetical protein
MSAQSYNTTAYDSPGTLNDKTGISPGFPLRNASDYSRMLRERSVYRESKTGTERPTVTLVQSVSYNINNAFGRVECGGCTLGSVLTDRKLGT